MPVARASVAVVLLQPLAVSPSEGEVEAECCGAVALGLPDVEVVLLVLALRSGEGEGDWVPVAQAEVEGVFSTAEGEFEPEELDNPEEEAAVVREAVADAANSGEPVGVPPVPQAVGDAQLLPLAAPCEAEPLPLAEAASTLPEAHADVVVLGRALALSDSEAAVREAGSGVAHAVGEVDAEDSSSVSEPVALRVAP